MLALPDVGMHRSIEKNNVKFDILCDWIEGSILFNEDEDEFSVTDVANVLIDENVCEEQDFAMEIVSNAWSELERRLNWLVSGMPFSINDSRAIRIDSWQETPAHSFCVLLSLAQCYEKWWERTSGSDYREQGELFELLTQESLENQFLGWQVEHTGWFPNQPTSLPEVVNKVADYLGETVSNNLDQWIRPQEKDAGLDLLCYRPFSDKRGGFPVYLIQCASGQDWKTKMDEPNIRRWGRFIEFVAPPQKAFSTPFALSDGDFKKLSLDVEGLFLDRYRLLAAAKYQQHWESSILTNRIVRWATPRVDQLPRN